MGSLLPLIGYYDKRPRSMIDENTSGTSKAAPPGFTLWSQHPCESFLFLHMIFLCLCECSSTARLSPNMDENPVVNRISPHCLLELFC